jgi:3-hydroxyisobutyrate dehydrogenase-like beta-hydroxyacid dehydrogenase
MEPIGFIGVGAMGASIASRLAGRIRAPTAVWNAPAATDGDAS